MLLLQKMSICIHFVIYLAVRVLKGSKSVIDKLLQGFNKLGVSKELLFIVSLFTYLTIFFLRINIDILTNINICKELIISIDTDMPALPDTSPHFSWMTSDRGVTSTGRLFQILLIWLRKTTLAANMQCDCGNQPGIKVILHSERGSVSLRL